jgi:toxin ParE1/3/4
LKRLIIAPSARLDFQEIHDYIAEDNADAASRWIDILADRFDLLCSQPGIGRQRDEIRPGYRSVAAGDYVIFFRKWEDDALEVVRVIHGKRDLSKMAFPE